MFGLGPEFDPDKVFRPGPEASADIIARDDKFPTVVRMAADQQMNMRVVGVPMIDRDPVEPRAEVFLHLVHEVPRVGAKVGHVGCVFRRDDEAEVMAVRMAAFGKFLVIDLIVLSVEQSSLHAFARHAIPR